MVIMIKMEIKYATPLSQLHHLLYLLHPADLSSSRAFSSPPSVLLSSILLIIIVYHLCIIMIKKLMNLDCLICSHCRACFVSVDSQSAGAGSTFDSICTVCKSFSR